MFLVSLYSSSCKLNIKKEFLSQGESKLYLHRFFNHNFSFWVGWGVMRHGRANSVIFVSHQKRICLGLNHVHRFYKFIDYEIKVGINRMQFFEN